MSYLIVIFSLLSSQLAQAQSCDDKSPVKVSQLQFVGEDLRKVLGDIGRRTECHVAEGYNADTAARKYCMKKYNMAAVNPGNPQYNAGSKAHGSAGSNHIGYYFCMAIKKNKMCEHMKAQKASVLDVRWVGTAPFGDNDGDCKCKRKGASASEEVDCPAETNALESDQSTGCKIAGAIQEGSRCVCENDREIEAKAGVTCPGVKAAPVSPTATVKEEDFAGCFADIEKSEAACSQKGQDAFDKCSKESPENNKNISEAQRVLSIGVDAMVAQNAGSGALESCAKMSALGTGVIEALSLFQTNCRKELDACKQGCADVKAYSKEDTAKLAEACKAQYESRNPGKTWSEEHQSEFATRAERHKSYSANVDKFCKGDVQVAEGQFDDMLQRLATSVQKADICKCQLTAGSTSGKESCDNVVTPLTCMQNMNQQGCSYSSVGCPPGSTDPRCKGTTPPVAINGSGVGAPISGFASPGFSSAGGGANGGKVQIGDSDLSGLYDETRPTGSGTATADAGSPFAPAAAAGSPGASLNMGNGDASGGAGNGEGGEKGGLSGFFQNAKGAISSMFGGGSGEKGSTTKSSNGKAYKNDMNGFRPKAPALRGMANAGEFGGKNRDIWKIMNQRYNDQYHTFITVETPSK